MVSAAVIFLSALAAGGLLMWGVLYLVRQPNLLAHPNDRSSHSEPTPTMGGVVIVVLVLAYLAWVAGSQPQLGWSLFGALAVLALVGLWDDLAGLSAQLRLLVHAGAAALALWGLQLDISGLWLACIWIGLMWLINLYNFMDGIDGLAASQTLVFCLGVHWLVVGVPGWSGDLLWLLGGVTLAFCGFNWPPAKIFMGDVGSGFLGLLLGVVCLYVWQSFALPLVASLILLAVFWFDATYTLCVRIATQQKFTQAHRSHMYQQLAQRRGHLWTTNAFLIFSLCWLLPMAWLTVEFAHTTPAQIGILVLAVLPLAILCWRLGAGLPPNSPSTASDG
ncbi:MAG: glycosyl transferase [Pseudomonadaceae bacterium]|nr:glycosyl transferase [Pseudomonadaceae bacterium]